MKTLLINPPMYDQRKNGKPFILPYGPPLGIAYLASTLETHGFYVNAIDMFDYSWDKVRQVLEKEQPDVVGITCLTEQRASPLEVAKLSKTINKDCVLIMGGIHPTIMCEQVLGHWPVDIIVLGEGEETIKELMICLEEKKDIGDVQGIAYKYQGKIIRTPPRQLIHNLDDISFPGTELYELVKQKGLVTDDYWLTDRPAPYFTIENNLEKLLEWSNIIMSANAGIVGKLLRRLRNMLERSTGLRVTGEGIGYRKNGLVKRLGTWT